MKMMRCSILTIAALALLSTVLSAQANAPQFKLLHTFRGESDGANTLASLIMDDSGNLYGTTTWGGGSSQCTNGCGFVFELSPTGSGAWKETLLHRFAGGADGAYPEATLLRDDAGNLYGTTVSGGASTSCPKQWTGAEGCGTVFELSPSGGHWTEIILHSFSGGSDGVGPNGGLIIDSSGTLYGTTMYGGSNGNCCGVVFRLSQASGGSWTETVLHAFAGTDGQGPFGNLLADASGNLYGTAAWGGNLAACPQSPGCGVVFRLAPASRGTWKFRILHTFEGQPSGQAPVGSMFWDSQGNLYGATAVGGVDNFGSIFELSGTANGWRAKTIHSFSSDLKSGVLLNSGLIFDRAGNLYGTTVGGGNSAGVVFKLAPTAAGGWAEKILYTFSGSADGQYLYAGLVADPTGHLYGATERGGGTCDLDSRGCGTIFEISLPHTTPPSAP